MTTATITDTLRQCHEIVWEYREELKEVWPTPSAEDCLLFSFCELGESIDAALRSNGDYARNRDKSLDVLNELSDFAMMLLTAMGPTERVTELGAGEMTHTWQEYVTGIAGVMQMQQGSAWADYNLTQLLARIATHPGMDLPTQLVARLERIKAKRLGVGA